MRAGDFPPLHHIHHDQYSYHPDQRCSLQLESDRLQVGLARHLLDQLASAYGAGEGDLADFHVLCEVNVKETSWYNGEGKTHEPERRANRRSKP